MPGIWKAVLNLGLYGPGVLLVREAAVRWRKGWATILMLGCAYGILEEGVALSTLFNPLAGPVGKMGFFGHWLGVSWVWSAGVLLVHMVYSISIPILILGLALPETKGRSLLSGRWIAVCLFVLGLDVLVLFEFVLRSGSFWMGWNLFIASFIAIGVFVYAARRAPANALQARASGEGKSAKKVAILGALFFPAMLLTEFVGMGVGLPPSVVLGLMLLEQGGLLITVLRSFGQERKEPKLVAFLAGILLPLAVFGLIAEITLPLVIVVDVAMFIFLGKLWRMYHATPASPQPQPQPLLAISPS